MLRYHAARFFLQLDILSQRECVGSQITSARQAWKVQCKLRQRLKATQHWRDADGRTSPVRLRSHWSQNKELTQEGNGQAHLRIYANAHQKHFWFHNFDRRKKKNCSTAVHVKTLLHFKPQLSMTIERANVLVSTYFRAMMNRNSQSTICQSSCNTIQNIQWWYLCSMMTFELFSQLFIDDNRQPLRYWLSQRKNS